MWYLNPAWYALSISVTALIVSGSFSWRIFKLTHAMHSTYQCDSQFLEIEKLFISEPQLYSFYRLGPAMTAYWDGLSEQEKRLYIFTEIHYFHLAFAYREYRAKRVPIDYWRIYQNWLNTLVNHCPMFMEIHKREGGNFEKEFAELVATQSRQKPIAAASNATAAGDP
ncbi:MAG TPA: hypothetical protein VGN24_01345 [Rhodanobacter sp.]|jgi:hypothetical protein|nr:hypothetical protein [Rhodanobacter sp.]